MARTAGTAEPFVPDRPSLSNLRRAVQDCRGCELYRDATRAVFGEGRRRARVMLVGEVPGDREDIEGRPFVGPAGRELDRGLDAAGIDREDAYVTNAVKHFRFERRGKRRIHRKPTLGQMSACRPWLDAEIAVVRPEVVVCLGATATRAVAGPGVTVSRNRGTFVETDLEPLVTITVHPSAILRSPDEASRRAEREAFERDLSLVARAIRA
ncbi:MAG TPA: UdgX family uracil-DNA binding protein [Actinomycetota bacterium]|nr:UdgX family uracil-DNA binding protein [Actinomycetota bacterium]